MRSRRALFSLLALIGIAVWSQASPRPQYDVTREKTLTGVVDEVKAYTCPVSGALGGHFVMQTFEGNRLEVHLAATTFLQEYGMSFVKGDKVEVIAAPTALHGAVSYMARKVERGNDIFFFRDPKGRPLW